MKKNIKYVVTVVLAIVLIMLLLRYTYSFENDSLLANLDITVDEENNLTTTLIPEIDSFLKNPYKGYSSEDAYTQTTGVINWKDSVDEYATEGYLRLNWYLFYEDTFVGPTDATNYKDSAYDWSVLFNLIKLYADHNMQLRFGVMTANTTSTDGAVDKYYSNSGNISTWYSNALIDLQMPKGSIIPEADYIPVISLEDEKVKLMCGNVDCSEFDSSSYDNYTHTTRVVMDDEVVYKARNITPMWMFEGIPSGYDENNEPIYDENAVKWYLDKRNVQWVPKWDDQNLVNNINDFVSAMSNYLKNEEYNGKKLIDYISFVEVRSYGNYGENHIDDTSLTSVDDDFRTPLLCGYLDTSAHNYIYAYEKDENFTYPSDCYFDLNDEKVKIYNGQEYHLSYTDTIKYYTNISFEYYQENYLKTYIEAFKDTNVRLVFNWFSSWDSDYYYDKGYVANGTIKELLEEYRDYLTIRIDSVFGSSFGEGYQLSQSNGISPTAFEYVISKYQTLYEEEDYFPLLKTKISENNLCSNKYNCLTNYFVHVVENGRASYMDYNYILYDYYQNYLNGIEDDYLLDLDYLGNSLGYHFIMKEVQFTTKVDMSKTEEKNLNVNLKVVNDGVTYLYDNDDTEVYLALLETDGDGNVIKDVNNKSMVVSKFFTNVDPTTWKSSMDITGNRDSNDSNNLILENIELNVNDIDEGKYILALGIFTDFDSNYPTIKLGNSGKTEDNWYALGEIELINTQYNISYDGNGGNGFMDSINVNVGEKKQLSKNIFTREGYIFDSWNTKKDGTGTTYTDEQEIELSESMVLYAQWIPITYNIIFNSNNGFNEIQTQTLIYDKEAILSKNTFINDGYKFDSWNTKADGSGIEYQDEQSVMNLLSEENATMDLYASWVLNEYLFISNLAIKDDKILYNLNVDDTYENLLKNIDTDGNITILDKNNNEIFKDSKLSTANIINIEFDSKTVQYLVSVLGDVNGDGKITVTDVSKLFQHYRGNISMDDIYIISGDTIADDTIKLTDVTKLYQYVRGTITSLN